MPRKKLRKVHFSSNLREKKATNENSTEILEEKNLSKNDPSPLECRKFFSWAGKSLLRWR
jgi:hypothetical protein